MTNCNRKDSIVIQSLSKNEEICSTWNEPSLDDLEKLLLTMDTISANKCLNCFANFECYIKGSILIDNELLPFEFNAGGWAYIGKKDIYLESSNPGDSVFFLSQNYCDKNWD